MRRNTIVALVMMAAVVVSGCSGAADSGPLLDQPLRRGTETTSIGDVGPGPYIVNFWATYCEPCRRELPLLAAAAITHPDVRFVGVNVLDDDAAAEQMLDQAGVSYVSLADPLGDALRAFRVRTLPATFAISSSGQIAASQVGELDAKDLDELLDSITSQTTK